MRKLAVALALVLLSAIPAIAAENQFVGTWKLDLAKSNFVGDTFTYTQLQNGMMHFSDGSAVNADFGLDGKDYPDPFGQTISWKSAGDNVWNTVSKMNGKVLSEGHVELSDGGNTLTIKDHGTKPDGSSFNDETVYKRVGAGSGLAGKWRSTKVNISAPNTYVVSAPSAGAVRWEIPEYKEVVEGKTDGSDLPLSGPTAPKGLTLSIKMMGPKKLEYSVKLNGKTIAMATQTLSADGKTITETSWSPGKESEKQTAVYTKQ
jgi:hypothetical protein